MLKVVASFEEKGILLNFFYQANNIELGTLFKQVCLPEMKTAIL